MSNCIKDLYDYDLVKKCCRCKNILLNFYFHQRSKSSDGLQSQCKFCVNDFFIKSVIIKIMIQNLSFVKIIDFKIMER